MSKSATSARARLESWRRQGADQFDPVRFHLMETLATRASTQADAVREVLEEKLARLVDAYAATLKKKPPRYLTGAAAPRPSQPGAGGQRSTLGALTDQMTGHAGLMEMGSRKTTPSDATLFPELPALDDFRRTWTSVRTASQLRQSLQDAPENAGPLNSSVLVHRCISLMRERSPGYLQHFLGYIDALSWLQQMHTVGVLANGDTARAVIGGKRATPKRRA